MERRGISLGRLECRTDSKTQMKENNIERTIAPRTTDEQAKYYGSKCKTPKTTALPNESIAEREQPESLRVGTKREDEPLSKPDESSVLSGQLEPGLI